MEESFVDPETGWIVTRKTILKHGVDFVEESITDPQTGKVEDKCERPPGIPRDIGAWVRSIARSREDLKQAKRIAEAARRVMLMVRELHERGYQRLRLAPGMSPSGCYWRGDVAPVRNILRVHGARVKDFQCDVAAYTTGQEDRFFGWEDAGADSPAELATKFISRFPELAAAGLGEEANYVRWYADVVEATEPAGLIYAYSDWNDSNPHHLNVIGESRQDKVPYPPPGEADEEQWAY